jgi:hypothetical protein
MIEEKRKNQSSLSEGHLQVLEHLHTFRFLTVPQMLRLGIATNKYTLSRYLTRLSGGSRPFTAWTDFGNLPNIGRLPRIHYLLKRGAKALAEVWRVDEREINYPRGVRIFSRDYFHRVNTVDLHIALRNFVEKNGLETDFFHTYFDHIGVNRSNDPQRKKRQTLTRVPLGEGYLIPDVIFGVTDTTGKPWICTAEIYRGFATGRVHQQLEKHLYALQEQSISKAYAYPRAVRILVVCENDNAMAAATKRVREDRLFAEAEAFFLFSALPRIQVDFAGDWFHFSGQRGNIFTT